MSDPNRQYSFSPPRARRISDLIQELSSIKEEHGNLVVKGTGTCDFEIWLSSESVLSADSDPLIVYLIVP